MEADTTREPEHVFDDSSPALPVAARKRWHIARLPRIVIATFLASQYRTGCFVDASLLTRHVLPTAVCADGSPATYYMERNAASEDYLFFFEGGMGCAHDIGHCEELLLQAAPLFTSDGFPDEMRGYGILSGDVEENAAYSTFNRIYVPYCSMDMYLLDGQSQDGELQFRGRKILEETMTAVLEEAASENSTVLLAGTSAGGVGAFNAVSYVLDSFAKVKELSMILDSAFFFDVHGYLLPLLEFVLEDPAVAYSPYCSEIFDEGPCCAQLGCMLQKGYYPREDPRVKGMFVINSLNDGMAAYQIDQTGRYDAEGVVTLWDAAIYTGEMAQNLHTLAALYPSDLSVFSPSCTDHALLNPGEAKFFHCLPAFKNWTYEQDYSFECMYGEDGHAIGRIYVGDADMGMRWQYYQHAGTWETLEVDGTSVRAAMEAWWAGRGDASKQVILFDSCDDFSCNPTCSVTLLPGRRDSSASYLVWFIVLVTLAFALATLGSGIFAVVWGCIQWWRVKTIAAAMAADDEIEITLDKVKGTNATNCRSASLSDVRLKQAGRLGFDSTKTPILEWQDLNYWVPQRGSSRKNPQEKQLLCSVDGEVPEGSLCALMGPSGSGKSTLLNLLTGRGAVGRCEGEIYFEGKNIVEQQDSYILKSGYMRQDNTGFLDGLTVFDNLVYAAMLRMPGTLSAQVSRVETVMEETALVRTRHMRAGSLSGGQKRRLTLALELLADRRILFLDEPTSGLDATASLDLLRILKRLSRKVTLVVAIHQPRPEIWQLFSHTILVKSGRAVFCGRVSQAIGEVARYLPGAVTTKGERRTKYVLRHRGSLSPSACSVISDMTLDLSGCSATTTPRSGTHGQSSASEFSLDSEDFSDNYSSSSSSALEGASDSASMSARGVKVGGGKRAARERGRVRTRAADLFQRRSSSGSRMASRSPLARVVAAAMVAGGTASSEQHPTGMPQQDSMAGREGRSGKPSPSGDDGDHSNSNVIDGVLVNGRTATRGAGGIQGKNKHGGKPKRVFFPPSSSSPPSVADVSADSSRRTSLNAEGDVFATATPHVGDNSSVETSPFVYERKRLSEVTVNSSSGSSSSRNRQSLEAWEASRVRWGCGRLRQHQGMPVLRHHSTFDEDGSEDLAHGQRHLGAQRSGIGARLSLPRVTLSGGLQRSVPDKILDMLVTIDAEELAEMQIHEAALRQRPKLGLRRSPDTALGGTGGGDALIPMTAALQDVQEGLGDHSPGTEVINLGQPSRYILSSCGFGVHCGKSPTDDVDGEEKGDSLTVMEGGGAEGLEVTAVVVGQEEGAGKREEERMGRERYEGRHKTTPLWQVAAILLSRAGKGGYAMEMLMQFAILEGAMVLMAVSFRAADGESMFHLVFSVLLTMVMPVLLMYHPVLIPRMWDEWILMKTELVDGFYPSACVVIRTAMDHMAIGVLGSFSVVGVMHVILWHDFIDALPVSAFAVYILLSCGVTLMAWVMIALFDALTISGLPLTHVFTFGVSLSAIWAFFSGTVMLITTLPDVLKFVSYTSPHFWNTSFMLRILLDGLDMSARCEYDSPVYCATSYGDLVADGLGLRLRSPATNVLIMLLFAISCIGLFIYMTYARGRRVSVFGGLLSLEEDYSNSVRSSKPACTTNPLFTRTLKTSTVSLKSKGFGGPKPRSKDGSKRSARVLAGEWTGDRRRTRNTSKKTKSETGNAQKRARARNTSSRGDRGGENLRSNTRRNMAQSQSFATADTIAIAAETCSDGCGPTHSVSPPSDSRSPAALPTDPTASTAVHVAPGVPTPESPLGVSQNTADPRSPGTGKFAEVPGEDWAIGSADPAHHGRILVHLEEGLITPPPPAPPRTAPLPAPIIVPGDPLAPRIRIRERTSPKPLRGEGHHMSQGKLQDQGIDWCSVGFAGSCSSIRSSGRVEPRVRSTPPGVRGSARTRSGSGPTVVQSWQWRRSALGAVVDAPRTGREGPEADSDGLLFGLSNADALPPQLPANAKGPKTSKATMFTTPVRRRAGRFPRRTPTPENRGKRFTTSPHNRNSPATEAAKSAHLVTPHYNQDVGAASEAKFKGVLSTSISPRRSNSGSSMPSLTSLNDDFMDSGDDALDTLHAAAAAAAAFESQPRLGIAQNVANRTE